MLGHGPISGAPISGLPASGTFPPTEFVAIWEDGHEESVGVVRSHEEMQRVTAEYFRKHEKDVARAWRGWQMRQPKK
jgi:hypothetical protein